MFLHSVTGSVPNLRWEDFSASCCFMSALIRLSVAAAVSVGLKAPNWPREDISPMMGFDNYRSSCCGPLLRGSQWGSGRESQGSDCKGGLMLCKLEAGGNGCSAFHGLFPTSCGDRAHFETLNPKPYLVKRSWCLFIFELLGPWNKVSLQKLWELYFKQLMLHHFLSAGECFNGFLPQ